MAINLTNFINNEFVPPQSGTYIDSYNPATATVEHNIPDSDASDVNAAVAAAKAAFPGWSGSTRQQRSDVLYKVANLLESRLHEFAAAESADQGKPVSLATRLDIPRAVYNFRFFAGAILHTQEMCTEIDNTAINYVVSQPIGVAGLISPWNLPLYLLTWKIAPCIAAGNTCVCKPSEVTSVTAHMLCGVLKEAGVPPGVVNMVFGLGAKTGQTLVEHVDVGLISFTGGTATGRKIQQSCAAQCKKLSLELGGKNPTIICGDADLDEAVPGAVLASFANQGEVCLCGERLFVHESIYDEFLKRFVEQTKKLVVGDPKAAATTTGPLVSKEHMEKVLGYIELAKEEGGTIVLGGDRPKMEGELANGYFVNPTIVTGLDYQTRCQTEEIFGPVVCVCPFKTEEEVIEWSNSVQYGLSASVWTRDTKAAHRISLKLQTGTVWVNCWLLRDLRVPFGGTKQSGIGREGGHFSLEFFTEQKTICMKYT